MANTITVALVTDNAGLQRGLSGARSQLGLFGKTSDKALAAAGTSGGSRMGSAIGTALKRTAQGVGIAAGGLLAAALTKGFQRLVSIENATAKLKGLGHSAKAVDKIMTNALASVKGTAFGLDEAATVAASSVAAGIKPGKQLEATLRTVADAATIGGTSMGEMGAIFNKVATSNKLQGDVINQLNERGIPIVQLLGKTMGKTSAEVTSLARRGKIDFATFSKAMESGLGGAALKSGETFTGAFKNLQASIGRIGANLLSGIFPKLAPGLQALTQALGPVEDIALKVGTAIGTFLGPAIERLAAWISTLDFTKLTSGAGSFGQIGDALSRLGETLAGVDLSKIGQAFASGTADTISVFAVAIGFAADHIDTFAKILPALVAAFVAYKVAQGAANVASLASVPIQIANVGANLALASANRALATSMLASTTATNVGSVARSRSVVATVASTVATGAAAAAAKVMAVAQGILNAVMMANPVFLVVAAIVALVAIFILAYKKSETFRNIVNGAFNAVKKVVTGAVNFVVNFVKNNWKKILIFLTGPIGIAVALIAKHWDKIKAGVARMFAAVKTKFGQVVSFVKGIPGKILRALGNLGKMLFNAGKKILQGLINGIKSMYGKVESAVNWVTDKIPDWKGPLPKDKKLLEGAGEAIMGGLIRGIESKETALRNSLRGVTDTVAGISPSLGDVRFSGSGGRLAIAGVGSGGGNTYHVTVVVNNTDSPVEQGRKFKNAIREYERVGGR